MRRIVLASIFLGAALSYPTASAEPTREMRLALVPLQAVPLEEAQLQEHAVAEGEPFALQRLNAVKSVTLSEDVTLDAAFGAAAFPKGARLILAHSGTVGPEYYCGDYQTGGVMVAGLARAARTQWVCFEDSNGDGVFEAAYSTNYNEGALLPSFNMLLQPSIPLRVAYTTDAAGDVDFYETSIVFKKSFNIYGMTGFIARGRRNGVSEWSDLTSTGKGVLGGFLFAKPKNLPKALELNGTKFEFVSRTKDQVTIRPISGPTGTLLFTVSHTYGRY